MCKRCVIFTYDEVLDIVLKLEVGVPLNFNPDWPARTTEAYPKSVAPLIVPKFDTAASTPTLTPGSLGVRELSWGFEESWKPGVVFNTRIDAASFLSPLSSRHIAKKPIPRPKRENPSNANTNSVFLSRILSSSAARGVEALFPL